jgi:hypothetical protein
MSAPATFPAFDINVTLLSQYANSPVITTLMQDFGAYFDPTANLTQFYNLYWNIDTAQGAGLDIWGRILDVSRIVPIPGTTGAFGFDNPDRPPDWQNWGGGPFFAGDLVGNSFRLNDPSYRTLLLTKALANIVTTTAPALNALVRNLFPGRGRCYTLDLGGMAMRYVFEFGLTSIEYAILAYSGVLPHPAGVAVSILVIPASSNFGFKEALPGAKPFGYGVFYLPGASP